MTRNGNDEQRHHFANLCKLVSEYWPFNRLTETEGREVKEAKTNVLVGFVSIE